MQNICWLDPSWHVASLLWTGDLNDVREATNIIKARHYQMKSRGLKLAAAFVSAFFLMYAGLILFQDY